MFNVTHLKKRGVIIFVQQFEMFEFKTSVTNLRYDFEPDPFFTPELTDILRNMKL